MYEAFYGLSRRPFPASPDAVGYVPTPTAEAAREALSRCLQHGRGIALLTAAPGLGKSSLAQKMANELEPEFATVFLANAGFNTRRSLLQAILYELGHPYVRLGEQEARLELTTALRELQQETSGLVLIIDEAHLLNTRLLEELRALSNQSSAGEPLLRLLLCADLELEETLAEPGLDAFNQRVACHVSLDSLNTQESLDYLQTRLSDVGCQPLEVFTVDALMAIARAADGSPRCLNQLADHALLLGYVAEERPIGTQTVHDALQDLKQLPLRWNDLSPASDSETVSTTTESQSESLLDPSAEPTVNAAVAGFEDDLVDASTECIDVESESFESLSSESVPEDAVEEVVADIAPESPAVYPDNDFADDDVSAADDSAAAFVEQSVEETNRPAPFVFETGCSEDEETSSEAEAHNETTIDCESCESDEATAVDQFITDETTAVPADSESMEHAEPGADIDVEDVSAEAVIAESDADAEISTSVATDDAPAAAVFEIGGPAEDELTSASNSTDDSPGESADPVAMVESESIVEEIVQNEDKLPAEEQPVETNELQDEAADDGVALASLNAEAADEQAIDVEAADPETTDFEAKDPAAEDPESEFAETSMDVAAFVRSTLGDDEEASLDVASLDNVSETELAELPNEVAARFADFVVDPHVGLSGDKSSEPSAELTTTDEKETHDAMFTFGQQNLEPEVDVEEPVQTADELSDDEIPREGDDAGGSVDNWVEAVLTPASETAIPDFPVIADALENPGNDVVNDTTESLSTELSHDFTADDVDNNFDLPRADVDAETTAVETAIPVDKLTQEVSEATDELLPEEISETETQPLTLPADLQQEIARTADAVFLPEWEHEVESVTAGDGSDAELRAWGVVGEALEAADDEDDATDPLADLAAEEERFPQPEASPHAEPEWPIEQLPENESPSESDDITDTSAETTRATSQSIYEQYDDSDPRRRLDEVLPLLEELISTSSAECDEMLSAIKEEVPADGVTEAEPLEAVVASESSESIEDATIEQTLIDEDSVAADVTVPEQQTLDDEDLEARIGALVLDTAMEVHAEVHSEPLDTAATRELAEELQLSANAAEFYGDSVTSPADQDSDEYAVGDNPTEAQLAEAELRAAAESATSEEPVDSPETILAEISTFNEPAAENAADVDDFAHTDDATQATEAEPPGVEEDDLEADDLHGEPASVETPAWQYDIVQPEDAEEEATIEMASAGRMVDEPSLEPEQKRYRQLFSQLRRRLTGDRNAG